MNGKRLAIARQRKGLSRPELAGMLGVTSRTVGGWECGTTEIPPERMESIVDALGFPQAFFERSDPAGVGINAVSFRSLSRKSAAQRDAALAMCDLAVDFSAWLDSYFDRDRANLPDLSSENAEFAADLLRREWGLGHSPIANLTHLVEAKGARVFGLPNNCREIDACSFWLDGVPYILLDTTRSAERIRFNIAHELGHLILHRHGAPVGQEAEKEANAFASCLLMPVASLQRHMPRYLNLETIVTIKIRWGVSAAALAYRMNKIGYLSEWQYKSMVIEMRRRLYHEVEPNSVSREQSHVLDAILKALLDNKISLRRVSDETNLPFDEVVGLMQGLASVAISAHDLETPDQKRAKFRVV